MTAGKLILLKSQKNHRSNLICNDLLSSTNSRDHHKLIKLLLKASGKSFGYQFPALATLIYVDWLPTGQWSRELYRLKAWITDYSVPT